MFFARAPIAAMECDRQKPLSPKLKMNSPCLSEKRTADRETEHRRQRPKIPTRESQQEDGGAGGIRTLDRALQPYNGLANRRLQPLGHSSCRLDMPDAMPSRKRQLQASDSRAIRRRLPSLHISPRTISPRRPVIDPAVGSGTSVSCSSQMQVRTRYSAERHLR